MQETVIFSGAIIGEGQRVERKVRATKSLLDEDSTSVLGLYGNGI